MSYSGSAPGGGGGGDHGALTGLTDDDHTQYQKESEKGAASGYASLGANTKVPTAELGGAGADSTKFLRGDQTWAVGGGGVTDHGDLTGLTDDDHAQYQKESEKSAASGYASLGANTKVPPMIGASCGSIAAKSMDRLCSLLASSIHERCFQSGNVIQGFGESRVHENVDGAKHA